MLEIKTRDVGGITVLDLNGSLVRGLGLESLRPRIEQLVAEKRLNVVLNASEVSVIDSSGIGELVASFSLLFCACSNMGKEHMGNSKKKLRRLFFIERL